MRCATNALLPTDTGDDSDRNTSGTNTATDGGKQGTEDGNDGRCDGASSQDTKAKEAPSASRKRRSISANSSGRKRQKLSRDKPQIDQRARRQGVKSTAARDRGHAGTRPSRRSRTLEACSGEVEEDVEDPKQSIEELTVLLEHGLIE